MEFKVPQPMRMEHEELLTELEKAAKVDGKVGEAAKVVAKAMQIHSVKEEEYALPPLALLSQLAAGRVTPEMECVLDMTNLLKEDLPYLLAEHQAIVAALMDLIDVAKAEGKSDCAHLAERLILHAQVEEEVAYPAAILIGEYLKLKLKR
jgi:ribosomal protein S7